MKAQPLFKILDLRFSRFSSTISPNGAKIDSISDAVHACGIIPTNNLLWNSPCAGLTCMAFFICRGQVKEGLLFLLLVHASGWMTYSWQDSLVVKKGDRFVRCRSRVKSQKCAAGMLICDSMLNDRQAKHIAKFDKHRHKFFLGHRAWDL